MTPTQSLGSAPVLMEQPTRKITWENFALDFFLIILITALAFAINFHPHFFGDELIAYELSLNDPSFIANFRELNANKPRLIFNAVEALLATTHAPRLIHAILVSGCLAWVNLLVFCVARRFFNASRALAWMLVLTILTSRYGIIFYFDYLSGLIETLSSALFFSTLLLAWRARTSLFKNGLAAGALACAVLTGLVHERYMVALLALGLVIGSAEWLGAAAKRRTQVTWWAISLSIVPLLVYWLAVKGAGSLPITTVGGAQRVALGTDTLWCMFAYGYNAVLGGNYGQEWLWGSYNHLHPLGKFFGPATAVITVVFIIKAGLAKRLALQNHALGLSLCGVVLGFIAIASVAGTVRFDARFMFPVGIVVLLFCTVVLKDGWRHVAISLTLVVNLLYIALDSHDAKAYIYASRNANALSTSLLAIQQDGSRGIVIGNKDNIWVIGGGNQTKVPRRRGEAFSQFNLRSAVEVDPLIEGERIDASLYDFALIFTGFGPHRTANYRRVSVEAALISTGALNLDLAPAKALFGGRDKWTDWNWSSAPEIVEGVVTLKTGQDGWLSVPAEQLHSHWLVYRARAAANPSSVPMRLQVNWHTRTENLFLSTSIQVVYPSGDWKTYSMQLAKPAGAEIGYVYATLHDGASGTVELQSVELK